MHQHVPTYPIPKHLPTLKLTTDASHEEISKAVGCPVSRGIPAPVCEIVGDAGVCSLVIAAGAETAVAGNGALWYFMEVKCQSRTCGTVGADLRYRDAKYSSFSVLPKAS